MEQLPKTKEEYFAEVRKKLNLVEKLTQDATSLDERLDITNLLIMEMVRLLGIISGAPGTEPPTIKAWPDNTDFAFIGSVELASASTAYQMPSFTVPSGFVTVLKAWPDNSGTVYVAFNEIDCTHKELSWPLMPGEYVGWQIKNPNVIYVSSTVAGDRAVVTVERSL